MKMDFKIVEVQTEEEFLKVYPLLSQGMSLENPTNILAPVAATRSWQKARQLGYKLYMVHDLAGALIAACGATEIYNPMSETPIFRVNNLIVDPAYRSRGIGRQVMSYIQEKALEAGGKFIFLEVMPDNVRAARFYTEELGYQYLCNQYSKTLAWQPG